MSGKKIPIALAGATGMAMSKRSAHPPAIF
jgi:hypothetical protein